MKLNAAIWVCLFLAKRWPALVKLRPAAVFGCLFLLFTAANVGRAQTNKLVVPTGLEKTAGDTFANPFFAVPPYVTQSYFPSSFGPISSDHIVLTQLAFRIDESEKGSLNVTIPRLRLTMAVVQGHVDDRNLPNPVVVFDEQNVSFNANTPSRDLGFDMFIQLDHPFLYDRTAGALVVRFESNSFSVGLGVDAQSGGFGELIYYEIGGIRRDVGQTIVTQFTYTTEPLTLSLLVIECIAFLALQRRSHRAVLPFVLCSLCLIGNASNCGAQTNRLVVPAGLENTFGNTSADPFFFADGPVTQTYEANNFASGKSQVLNITQVGFRIQESEKGSLDVVVPRIKLIMAIGDGRIDVTQLPNPTVVFDRQNVHLQAENAAANPNFDIFFTLDHPFQYDPARGFLILQFNSRQTSGLVQGVDAQGGSGGDLYYYEPGGALRAIGETIVTQFSYTTVPEPPLLAIFGVGLMVMWLAKKENRR